MRTTDAQALALSGQLRTPKALARLQPNPPHPLSEPDGSSLLAVDSLEASLGQAFRNLSRTPPLAYGDRLATSRRQLLRLALLHATENPLGIVVLSPATANEIGEEVMGFLVRELSLGIRLQDDSPDGMVLFPGS
jgi:hypothetical protein